MISGIGGQMRPVHDLPLGGEFEGVVQGIWVVRVVYGILGAVVADVDLDVEVAVAAVEGVNDAADINGVGMLHIDVRQVGSGGIDRPLLAAGVLQENARGKRELQLHAGVFVVQRARVIVRSGNDPVLSGVQGVVDLIIQFLTGLKGSARLRAAFRQGGAFGAGVHLLRGRRISIVQGVRLVDQRPGPVVCIIKGKTARGRGRLLAGDRVAVMIVSIRTLDPGVGHLGEAIDQRIAVAVLGREIPAVRPAVRIAHAKVSGDLGPCGAVGGGLDHEGNLARAMRQRLGDHVVLQPVDGDLNGGGISCGTVSLSCDVPPLDALDLSFWILGLLEIGLDHGEGQNEAFLLIAAQGYGVALDCFRVHGVFARGKLCPGIAPIVFGAQRHGFGQVGRSVALLLGSLDRDLGDAGGFIHFHGVLRGLLLADGAQHHGHGCRKLRSLIALILEGGLHADADRVGIRRLRRSLGLLRSLGVFGRFGDFGGFGSLGDFGGLRDFGGLGHFGLSRHRCHIVRILRQLHVTQDGRVAPSVGEDLYLVGMIPLDHFDPGIAHLDHDAHVVRRAAVAGEEHDVAGLGRILRRLAVQSLCSCLLLEPEAPRAGGQTHLRVPNAERHEAGAPVVVGMAGPGAIAGIPLRTAVLGDDVVLLAGFIPQLRPGHSHKIPGPVTRKGRPGNTDEPVVLILQVCPGIGIAGQGVDVLRLAAGQLPIRVAGVAMGMSLAAAEGTFVGRIGFCIDCRLVSCGSGRIGGILTLAAGVGIGIGRILTLVARVGIGVDRVAALVASVGVGIDRVAALVAGVGVGVDRVAALVAGVGVGVDRVAALIAGVGIGVGRLAALVAGVGVGVDRVAALIAGVGIRVGRLAACFIAGGNDRITAAGSSGFFSLFLLFAFSLVLARLGSLFGHRCRFLRQGIRKCRDGAQCQHHQHAQQQGDQSLFHCFFPFLTVLGKRFFAFLARKNS